MLLSTWLWDGMDYWSNHFEPNISPQAADQVEYLAGMNIWDAVLLASRQHFYHMYPGCRHPGKSLTDGHKIWLPDNLH
jgi:hypothetical protein